MKGKIIEWIKTIAIALLLAFIITHFISGTKVYGRSMYPTLFHEDFLIIFNSKKNIDRGDIVVIDTNLELTSEDLMNLGPIKKKMVGNTKKIVKRVIAIEGDSLIISEGKVYLNGKELKEDYINGEITNGYLYIEEIPKGKVFVMGDNRYVSLDSRDERIGLVDREDIMGKVVFRIYPLSKFGTLK